MERRECYERGGDCCRRKLNLPAGGLRGSYEAPIITDGDVSGCVAFVSEKEDEKGG